MTTVTEIEQREHQSRKHRPRKHRLRSHRLLIAIVAVMALIAASCSSDDDADAPASSDGGGSDVSAQESTQEPITLRWAMWTGSQVEVDAWLELADLVSEVHPHITIEFETTTFADHYTKLTAELAAGQAPCISGLQSLRTLGYQSAFVPLEDRIADTGFDIEDFDQSIVSGLTGDGALRAIPYDFGPMVMFYNKDWFAEAGVQEPQPGWSIEDFERIATELTGDDKYGFTASADSFWYLPLLFSYNGVSFVTNNSDLNLDDALVPEALEWYQSLISRGLAPEVGGAGYDARNEFAIGSSAMTVDGPWDLLNINNLAEFELGVVELPGSGTFSAGSGFGVTVDCDDPDEAFKAIQVITSDEALARLAELGRAYPARESQQHVFFEVAPYAEDGLLGAVDGAAPYRTSTNWDQVSEQLLQFGPEFLNGSGSGEDFIDNVQAVVGG